MYLQPSTQEDDKHFEQVHLPKLRPAKKQVRRSAVKKGSAAEGLNASVKKDAAAKKRAAERILLKQPFFVADLLDEPKTDKVFGALYNLLVDKGNIFLKIEYKLDDEVVVEDAASETIAALLEKKGWKDGGLVSYACGILYKMISNHFRSKAKYNIDYNADIDECHIAEEDFLKKREKQELIDKCNTSLQQLSPETQTIMHQHYWERKSFVKIGAELGKDAGNIRQKHHQAKDKLEEILRRDIK